MPTLQEEEEEGEWQGPEPWLRDGVGSFLRAGTVWGSLLAWRLWQTTIHATSHATIHATPVNLQCLDPLASLGWDPAHTSSARISQNHLLSSLSIPKSHGMPSASPAHPTALPAGPLLLSSALVSA